MSDGLNRVELIGNLCATPELRFTQGGQAVLNIRLATNETYTDKDGAQQSKVEYHSVVCWGKHAEALAKFLDKGHLIYVDGSLRSSSYDDKEGNKRYKTEINVNKLIVLGGKGVSDESDGSDPVAPRSASSGGVSAGDFEVAFGRDKGKRISEVQDLSWLRGTLEKDLADTSKARFHDKARGQLAAIDAELSRRSGGGAQVIASGGYGGGARETARTSSDNHRGGGGGYRRESAPVDAGGSGFSNDDDIPFGSSDPRHDSRRWSL